MVLEAFEQLAKVEHRAAELLAREGFDASEANPASVRGSEVYTGDWVGVAVLRVGEATCSVVLRPKVDWFHRLASYAFSALRLMGVREVYARLLSSLSAAGALRLPGAILAAEYISGWVRSRPLSPADMATAAYMVYAAVASAAGMLRSLHAPREVLLQVLQPLLALAADPLVARALLEAEEAEPDVDEVLEAALYARASLLYTRGGVNGPVLLLPSPKIFELAALAKTLEALRSTGLCSRPSWDEGARRVICGKRVSVYFNASPRSRIVERLAGARLHPDIVVELGGRLAVVEAKYRRRGSRLGLGDAARIAAYLYDLGPDHLVIVYPEHPEEPRRIAENVTETSIDTLPRVLRELQPG